MESPQRDATRTPYIAAIATARNDDHGGNMLRRLEIFARHWIEMSERWQLPTELLLVEWNPPTDRPSLAEALSWPNKSEFCDIRIVQVPPEIHNRYEHSKQLGLYQMIAKNVGIRRSRAEFILSTNIDLVFSDELFEMFAARRLKRGCIYRADRYDVEEGVPLETSVEQRLAYCQDNRMRVNGLYGTLILETGEYLMIHGEDDDDTPRADRLPVLHTNACGDFQLMAKEHWAELHGYAEFDMYSFHLDSLLQIAAHYHGLEEVRLSEPFFVYHIEHPRSGWKPETRVDPRYIEIFERKELRRLTDEDLHRHHLEMAQNQTPSIFSGADWGMAQESLPELKHPFASKAKPRSRMSPPAYAALSQRLSS